MADLPTQLGGYPFQDPGLLEEALSHPSIEGDGHYERLEFLGDSVLGFLVADLLLELYPDSTREGELTQLRSNLVSRPALARVARSLDLESALRFGAAFPRDAKVPDRVLCAAVEALLGAIYRDGGLSPARDFVRTWILAPLQDLDGEEAWKDPRNRLQEIYQARGLPPPEFETSRAGGPDHAPTFTASLKIGWRRVRAQAARKQAAIKKASLLALEALEAEPDLLPEGGSSEP